MISENGWALEDVRWLINSFRQKWGDDARPGDEVTCYRCLRKIKRIDATLSGKSLSSARTDWIGSSIYKPVCIDREGCK